MTSFPRLSFVCPIPWDTMQGDERERHCAKCARTVVNVSLLTTAEREALLAHPPVGGLCVAYYQRLSGEHVSAENPLTPAESKRVVQWGVAAASIAAAALAANLNPQLRQDVSQVASSAFAKISERGEEWVDTVGQKLGLKPAPPPATMMLLGAVYCPPTPASTGSAPSPAAPAVGQTPTTPAAAPAPTLPATQSI